MDAVTFTQLLPWFLAVAGAAAVVYERVLGRGVWRNVAEGRQEQIADLEKRVSELEARLDMALDSVFAEVIATRVVQHLREEQQQ